MNLMSLLNASLEFSPIGLIDQERFRAPSDAKIAYSEVAAYIILGNVLRVITDESETQYILTEI